MSLRITLALSVSLVISISATAQDYQQTGVITEYPLTHRSVGYIQSAIDSLKLNDTTAKTKSKDQVVTNLAEHPVHAMRRRKALLEAAEALLKSAKPVTLVNAAREIGLHGKWFVLSGEKDGLFSEAQIGQQPGDVISLLGMEDDPGMLPMG